MNEFLAPLHNMTMVQMLLLVFAYLLGSIPFGLLFTRLAKKGDIRQKGSGNIGATNVLRVHGKAMGALTLIADLGKGVIVLGVMKVYAPSLQYWAAILVVMGHNFPSWLKFKGGKGVATYAGALMMLNWPLGLLAAGCWGVGVAVTRISSLSALIASFIAPLIAYFGLCNWPLFYATFALSTLIWVRHISNIKRLLSGAEGRFK